MAAAVSSAPAPGNPRLQKLLLRFFALVQCIALPAVFVPRLALEKLSWLAGFGQPPMLPLTLYLLAGASCVYLGQAALLWMVSTDVVRYRPLVVFLGAAYTAFGPLFWWIDSEAGMPWWWQLMDSGGCLGAGLALLWSCGWKR